MIEAWWRSLKHQWLYLHTIDNIATVKMRMILDSMQDSYGLERLSGIIRWAIDGSATRRVRAMVPTATCSYSVSRSEYPGQGVKEIDRASREVRIAFRVGSPLDRSLDACRPVVWSPVEDDGRPRIRRQFPPLSALAIGVHHEGPALDVDRVAQHHPSRRATVRVDGRQADRMRVRL